MTLEEIKQKHIKIEYHHGTYEVWLVIDHQSFQLVASGERPKAERCAEMLAIALERIVK